MTLNLIPALREANPDHDIAYFCDRRLGAMDALGSTMHAAGVDMILDCAGWDRWRGGFDRAINLVGYPLAEGYPDKPMRWHLLQYFAEEMGLHAFGPNAKGAPPNLASLTLRRPRRPDGVPIGDYATLQVKAGWSTFKEWPRERWREVESWMPEIPIVLIDESEKRSIAESIAVFANAKMHLGIDSFTNHLSHFMWEDQFGGNCVRSVILWGSTQPDASGYATNVNIYTHPVCGPCFRETAEWSNAKRGPCIDIAPNGVHSCMDKIEVSEVVKAARQLWSEVGGRPSMND